MSLKRTQFENEGSFASLVSKQVSLKADYEQKQSSPGLSKNSTSFKMRFAAKNGKDSLKQIDTEAARAGMNTGRWSKSEHIRFV